MNVEERAFLEKLYIDKYDDLLRLVRKHLRDSERGQEIVQDTFISAQLSIKKLIKNGNPGGWLYKTLMNKIKHEERACQRFIKLQMALSQRLVTEGNISEFDKDQSPLLDFLTGDEYKLLTLIYIDGYKIAEASEILGITYETCRKRIHNARTKLHKNKDKFRAI